jgi:hypothetical protein
MGLIIRSLQVRALPGPPPPPKLADQGKGVRGKKSTAPRFLLRSTLSSLLSPPVGRRIEPQLKANPSADGQMRQEKMSFDPEAVVHHVRDVLLGAAPFDDQTAVAGGGGFPHVYRRQPRVLLGRNVRRRACPAAAIDNPAIAVPAARPKKKRLVSAAADEGATEPAETSENGERGNSPSFLFLPRMLPGSRPATPLPTARSPLASYTALVEPSVPSVAEITASSQPQRAGCPAVRPSRPLRGHPPYRRGGARPRVPRFAAANSAPAWRAPGACRRACRGARPTEKALAVRTPVGTIRSVRALPQL